MTVVLQFQSVGPLSTSGGAEIINVPIVVTNPNPLVTSQDLANGGNNTIIKPNQTTAVLIVPPSTNVTGLTVKGSPPAGGEVGIGISPTQPTFLSLAVAQGSFVIAAAAGADVLGVKFYWF